MLDLVDFTWGHGLPAGMHELEKINRMRIKKAWERILPPMDSSTNVDVCSKLINALEADSWAFREAVKCSFQKSKSHRIRKFPNFCRR